MSPGKRSLSCSFFPKEQSCPQEKGLKLFFFPKKQSCPCEKEFKLFFFLKNNHVLRRRNFFFPKHMVVPWGNLNLASFWNMVIPRGIT
jgi:hypothetical protein